MVIRPVIFHGLRDALAICAAARSLSLPVDLISAPGASAYIGAGMFAALCKSIRQEAGDVVGRILYDCGSRRGDVLAALRAGIADICLDTEAITHPLRQLAETHGARLETRPPNCLQWDGTDVKVLAGHLSHS